MQAVGGSEDGVDGRGGRGKQGALLVAGFRQSDYYTQIPKNQGLGRVWENNLHSFLPLLSLKMSEVVRCMWSAYAWNVRLRFFFY